MNIEIVTIGDELLLGFTIDTNAVFLARELSALGIAVVRRTTCGDEPDAIAAAVRDALERTGAVITTGGLGPTADDRSKAAVASIFGRTLETDPAILDGLHRLWRERGRPGELPRANHSQALVPHGATILTNQHGTAPGIWLEDEQGRWVAMLPGVPREMRGLFADELRQRLAEHVTSSGNAATVIRSATVRTNGIAESMLADMLGDLAQDTTASICVSPHAIFRPPTPTHSSPPVFNSCAIASAMPYTVKMIHPSPKPPSPCAEPQTFASESQKVVLADCSAPS
jgi:nicotinamide-nucleotide amidase